MAGMRSRAARGWWAAGHVVVVMAVSLVAVTRLALAQAGPSAVIFPPETIPLHFDHTRHVTKLGVRCERCHPAALAHPSVLGRARIAEVAACDECHGTDHSDRSVVREGPSARGGACASCHVGYRADDGNRVAPVVVPAPNLRFDHKAHADRHIGCGQCHDAVEHVALATREQLPRMRVCLKCHHMDGPARGDAKGECTTCHLRLPDGRMRTRFPNGQLVPPPSSNGAGHTPDFVTTHKRAAASDSSACGTCHTERECADCHDGRIRPRQLHPNDWISMHPSAARRDSPRCTGCHHQQSFCQRCHARAGLAMSGTSAQRARVHPAGWASLAGGGRSANQHAREAQRNLNACVSCHLERDCVVCHASAGRSGLGINPHPPGFSSRCRAALTRNSRPCLVCHEADAAILSRCN